jgi:drug/metabolite transporter (DMT)-like permease
MLTGSALFLAFISAFFYMAATFAMKYWGGQSLWIVLPLAGSALLLAALFEIEALKISQMARTFVVILSFEFMLTIICAIFLLEERYSMRDLLAICLMFSGIVLLSMRGDESTAMAPAKKIALRQAESVLTKPAEPVGQVKVISERIEQG